MNNKFFDCGVRELFVGGARNIVKNKSADVRWINSNFHVKSVMIVYFLCVKIKLYAMEMKSSSSACAWRKKKQSRAVKRDF